MRVRLLNGRFDSTCRRKKIGNLKPFLRKETSTDGDIVADSTWSERRRVVELGLLADRLNECSQCGQPLQLSDINSESHFGLASILHITCRYCQIDKLVSTGIRHSIAAMGPERCFDVNTKLAAGMCSKLNISNCCSYTVCTRCLMVRYPKNYDYHSLSHLFCESAFFFFLSVSSFHIYFISLL